MTEEVGAITGELELLTRVRPGGDIEAMVRYSGARDLYTVSGSPVRAVSAHPDHVKHRAAHKHILETLTTPGRGPSPFSIYSPECAEVAFSERRFGVRH